MTIRRTLLVLCLLASCVTGANVSRLLPAAQAQGSGWVEINLQQIASTTETVAFEIRQLKEELHGVRAEIKAARVGKTENVDAYPYLP